MSVRIIDNSSSVVAEASRRITAALTKVKPKIVASAQKYVPVISGDLQRSIEAEVEDGQLRVGSPLVYAAKVEMNTPYLRPAVLDNIEELRRAFKE